MATIDLQKIVSLGWTKRWAGAFSLLCASYFGEQYTTICRTALGAGFTNIFFAHKNGATTCYRVKQETENFGNHLTELALKDPNILDHWSDELKRSTDAIRTILEEPIENFLNIKKYCEFELLFENYGPTQFAVTTVPNFLPPQLLDSRLATIEDARRYSESVYNETEALFRSLCALICEKENIDSHFIASMYRNEMKDYIAEKKLPSTTVLAQRFNASGLYYNNSSCTILNNVEVNTLEELIAKRYGVTPGFAQGKPASPGKVTGVIRIVPDPRNVKTFNPGDILVTGMTRPDFVPLMKLSGAIVTDAGGLLCHAAIVSRELGKPCVIATEVATKAFKDGDVVEVDAVSGVVRKK